MGQIASDVRAQHLRIYDKEETLLKSILHHFDVNYARRMKAAGTTVSAYLLQPDTLVKSLFGFTDELLFIVSDYDKIQSRTMQAVEQIYSEQPFKARANPLTYIIVSKALDVQSFVQNYQLDHPQYRTPIPLNWLQMENNGRDSWYLRNALSSTLFTRDIFDYQLPLDEDMYFFGRTNIVNDIVDSVRKSENRGIFGLRKTGKTSILFKLRRICKETKLATLIYFDCKNIDIRSKHWLGLLGLVTDEIIRALAMPADTGLHDGMIGRFNRVVRMIPIKKKVCIVFDEIEYISPLAKLDMHWGREFIDFWQLMWSTQSEVRRISFIIAGVNPYLVELNSIDRIQNPVFGIVRSTMITGMNRDEVHAMVKRIGKQMGLNFDDAALDYIHSRYCGHPLLTRMACSYTNKRLIERKVGRPISLDASNMRNAELDRDSELQFYCRHIVSELQEFYEDEYKMLELLATGRIADFIEIGIDPQWVMHLKGYGIITVAQNGRPDIQLPVLKRYIAADVARREGSRELRTIVASENRSAWLESRKGAILRDLKALLRMIADRGGFQPYQGKFVPEADKFATIMVVTNWQDFGAFINKANQTFCETIDKIHSPQAFFGQFKSECPELFYAFNRIRIFRNDVDHIILHEPVQTAFDKYIDADLLGRTLSQVQEPWFVLQQVVVDELFAALLFEINSRN